MNATHDVFFSLGAVEFSVARVDFSLGAVDFSLGATVSVSRLTIGPIVIRNVKTQSCNMKNCVKNVFFVWCVRSFM